MWTADSIEITADQTCWTADGYNGCEVTPGKIEHHSYPDFTQLSKKRRELEYKMKHEEIFKDLSEKEKQQLLNQDIEGIITILLLI